MNAVEFNEIIESTGQPEKDDSYEKKDAVKMLCR
jgi:hypothetical protein